MCWNKLIQGGDSGTVRASAQHTPGSTHAIPDGTEGGHDSSPLPHPPKPKLGPGSGPRVGPAPEGDSFQPLALSPEHCRKMMPMGGADTVQEQHQLFWAAPVPHTGASRNPEHTGIFVLADTASLNFTSTCSGVKTPRTTHLSTWLNLATGYNTESQPLINGLYPQKNMLEATLWIAISRRTPSDTGIC